MILVCPNCATRYVVGDDAVPPGGRTVRCANCGERWRALPGGAEAPLELAPAVAAPAPETAVAAGGFGRASATPVSKAFRQQVQDRRRTRQAAATGVALAGAGALAVLAVLVLALFPVAVVRAVPRLAGVYAALGHPVNPTGLALEAQGEAGLAGGRPVMAVHGVERNVEAGSRPAVPLRVSLYDKAGHAAAVQVVRVDPAPIAPGEVRPFRAVFTDPPLSAVEFGVELAFDLPRAPSPPPARPLTPARPVQPARPSAAAAPSAPVSEAHPLPAGSPYALPPAAAAGPHG